MIKRFHLYTGVLTILILSTASFTPAADYDYIDINNPFLRKIPIAIPHFKPAAGTDLEQAAAVETSELMAEALVFSGYFKLLDRGAYLADPRTMSLVPPGLNFQNWTVIGADLLVTGGIQEEAGGQISMELRLFDTFKQELIVGKRYRGKTSEKRKMVHRFCSEILYHLTGGRGMFNSRIAFVSTDKSGNKDIYICDFDGENIRKFTNYKSITLSPAWSSDGKWLAFTSYKGGTPDLYIQNVGDRHGTVVKKKGVNISPAWLPTGFQLAATLSFAGDQEIYLLTGTGKINKRLTNQQGIDVGASWSPDGRRMAFVSKRQGTPQIYIKNLDTGAVRRLTYQGGNNSEPSWSPKGDKIAYTAIDNGQINIYAIDLEGGAPVQLTINAGDNESPTWAPDGSMIAFSSTLEGPARIYVMTAFGTDKRRLLSLPGKQQDPAWSPSFSE